MNLDLKALREKTNVAIAHPEADWTYNKYVEAINPETIKRLLDRLEAAERVCDSVLWLNNKTSGWRANYKNALPETWLLQMDSTEQHLKVWQKARGDDA